MGQRGGRAGQVDGGAKRDSKFGIRRERNLVRERVDLLTGKGMQGFGSAAALSALYMAAGRRRVKLPHSQPPCTKVATAKRERKGYKAGPR